MQQQDYTPSVMSRSPLAAEQNKGSLISTQNQELLLLDEEQPESVKTGPRKPFKASLAAMDDFSRSLQSD